MAANRRTLVLVSLVLVLFAFTYMATFWDYQNFVFIFFIMYFILSSLFLRPQQKKAPSQQKSRDGWNMFEDMSEEDMDHETIDKVQEQGEGRFSKAMRDLFPIDVEQAEKAESQPKIGIYDDKYGFDQHVTSSGEMAHDRDKMKDWGTVLYERIQASAKKRSHNQQAYDIEDKLYDDKEYAGEYRARKEDSGGTSGLLRVAFGQRRKD